MDEENMFSGCTRERTPKSGGLHRNGRSAVSIAFNLMSACYRSMNYWTKAALCGLLTERTNARWDKENNTTTII